MGETLTTFSPAQKEIYLGVLRDHLNSKAQIYGWMDKRGADGGSAPAAGSSTAPSNSRHFTAHTGRNAGGGFVAPDNTIPVAGNQSYKRGSYIGRTLYFPINVARSVIRNTRTDAAAYGRAMVESAKRAANDVTNEMERVVQGDGSGFLGEISSFSAGAETITLKNPADARKFYVGMYISPFSARTAGATQRVFDTGDSYEQVTAVNRSTGVITVGSIGAGNDLAAGDNLVRAYDLGSSSFAAARTSTIRYEPVGIDGIVSDRDSPMETSSTYGGLYGILAPADYGGTTNGASGVSTWASYVNRTSSTGRAYSDDILQSLVDMCEINSGMKPNLIITSYGGRNEFAKTKTAIRRTVNSMSISGENGGGFSEDVDSKRFLEYEDIPIVPSRYAPVGLDSASAKTCSFTAVNTERLWIDEWHKIRFMDDDGLTWRMVSRTPFFEAILEYQCEVVSDQRNCHAKATDILAADYV